MKPASSQDMPRGGRHLPRWRRSLRTTLRQPGQPHKIALGMAVGMFITFTPTVGIQIPLVLILATLLRCSRIAGLIPIWITNVFTAAPIYSFAYWLGVQVLPGEHSINLHELSARIHASMTASLDSSRWFAPLIALWDVTKDVYGPMMLGGALIGIVAAVISYPVTVRIVLWYRARRRRYLETHPNRGKYLTKRLADLVHPHRSAAPSAPHEPPAAPRD